MSIHVSQAFVIRLHPERPIYYSHSGIPGSYADAASFSTEEEAQSQFERLENRSLTLGLREVFQDRAQILPAPTITIEVPPSPDLIGLLPHNLVNKLGLPAEWQGRITTDDTIGRDDQPSDAELTAEFTDPDPDYGRDLDFDEPPF